MLCVQLFAAVSLRRAPARRAWLPLLACFGAFAFTGCGGGNGVPVSGSNPVMPASPVVNNPPAASGSSPRLLFATSNKPKPGIDTLLPDGTGLTLLTDYSAFPQHPRFNYDRSKIVYVAGSGVTHLIVVNADGSTPVTLPNPANAINIAFPQFRPDGKAVVFVADGSLYTMNVDGSNARRLAVNQVTAASWPTYTPDGAKIVFQRETELGNVGIGQNIAVMNADGSGETALTSDAASTQPAISPDGKKIAFHYSNAGHDEIRTMNPDGTGVQAVVNTKDTVSAPVFSPDGTKIGYLSTTNPNNLSSAVPTPYIVNGDGSNLHQVSNVSVDGVTLDWR